MSASAIVTAYVSLLVAGLAGSLHCVGMCGPILVGFSQVFERVRLTVHGQEQQPSPRFTTDFLWYHAGRIWTYAMLGLLAGIAGQGLRTSGAWLGWQRPLSLTIAVAVVVCGVLLLGLIPGLRGESWFTRCASRRFRGRAWFEALLHGRGPTARVLLGAVMGLLPCGLVYAMLVVVAALPHPVLSAIGMVAFGVGTLPALTAVLLASRMLPTWLRTRGTTLAAVTLIITGSWMFARTLSASPQTGYCPFCVSASDDAAAAPH